MVRLDTRTSRSLHQAQLMRIAASFYSGRLHGVVKHFFFNYQYIFDATSNFHCENELNDYKNNI